MKKIKLPWMERLVAIYLHPKYKSLFIAECFLNSSGKSQTGQKIIKKHFDSMSEREREALRRVYDEMTPEQRNKPSKLPEDDK